MPAACVTLEVALTLSSFFITNKIAFDYNPADYVGADNVINVYDWTDEQLFYALDKLASGEELDIDVFRGITVEDRAVKDGVVLAEKVLGPDEGVRPDGQYTLYNVWKARVIINGAITFEKRGNNEHALDAHYVEGGFFDHNEGLGQIY